MDGGDELLPGCVLHDEPGSPGAERLGRELGVSMHGQENHFGSDRVRLEPTQRLEPADAGHRHVGHDDVGAKSPRGLDQLRPVGHGSHQRALPAQRVTRASAELLKRAWS